ncbi:PKD-like family lipoprotein [Pedobacter sp. SL55]|uniref:PKD-like family lipoprotein n=1 Tax=Pedobacter sp. SL55 TaxID=2995161 RepID=UPI00226D525B|nr:PKD-like family lipoprotein [Pedobacter sp. SL55]WAC40817.1 PKD-like family lipoprotein [Pedobacter sp. SL55]
MTLKIYRSFLFILCLFIISSCKKDLGNYDYTELNVLDEITGLPAEVSAVYGKNLKINPVIKFTQDPNFDESKYTFEWTYIGPNGLGGSKLFSLAKTRNLDLVMQVVAGNYPAYYNITEKASGIKYSTKFTLKVVNEINEGWIMMNEANGKARVDMLSLNSNNNFDLIIDLLATTGSDLKLTGKPVMTYTYNTGLLVGPDAISYGLYLGTDQSTTKIDPNTFKWTKTMGLSYEMFGDIPAGFYADVIRQKSSFSSYMIGKGNAYYYERVFNIYYSAPINYINEEQRGFEVEPFIGSNHLSLNTPAIFYDRTNRRFVRHSGSAATSTTIPDPDAAQKLFSFSTGMDLVYMRWISFNGGEVFSILKDPANNKRYLARFNPTSNAQSYYSEITATDFSNAEFYAINPEFGYIFYTVGSKIYQYDMVYKTAKLMADFGAKKICYFNFYEFKNTTKYTGSNKLMVGIYDPSINNGTEGSLNIYTVPSLNGDIILDKTYSGFGRIKSLTYRER